MFWTRDTDSFNKFCELTVERRCKDPWFELLIEKDCIYIVQTRELKALLHTLVCHAAKGTKQKPKDIPTPTQHVHKLNTINTSKPIQCL